ncbi:hypothetical protein Mapa_006188 [Marchantia paleacea]|nr:hypothetical protein Mapa_006188 [Marchantia paleacea]
MDEVAYLSSASSITSRPSQGSVIMELEEEQVETSFRHCDSCTSTRVRCNCSSSNSWTHSTGKSMDTQSSTSNRSQSLWRFL